MKKLNGSVRKIEDASNEKHEAALRRLFMLSIDPEIDFDTKVDELLALGCEALELPIGIVSRIKEQVYTVRHVSEVEGGPAVGTTFDLGNTYCVHTLEADDVMHFHHAGNSRIANHPCYLDFGLESYIGVPLRAGDERIGTLNFSAATTRGPFSETEVELVRLFGRWLSEEWHRWRKRRELADKTILLNAIVEAVPDAVIAVNAKREIQMVNTATERMFGYLRDDLAGKTTSMFYPDDAKYAEYGERLYKRAEIASVDRFDMQLRRRDSRIFPGEVYMAPLRDEKGKQFGVVGVLRDVSDQRALEKAREELISTVTHELRTPITSANGALKLLSIEKHKLSPALQPTLDIAARNLDRLVMLVEDILTFEQLTTVEQTAELEPLKLGSLLKRAAEDIRPFASQNDVGISVHGVEQDDQKIMGDPHRLLQVLSNLMSNAIKASEPGSKIEIGTRADGPGFFVQDYGKGIPDSLKSKLFERFSRAPESYSEGHGGTGLGMGIVKTIIDQHEGEISFETTPGEGTTFTVALPAAAA